MVYALVATFVLEALLYAPPVWHRARRAVAFIIAVTLPAITFLVIADNPSFWGAGLAIVTVMRMFNLLRIISGRIVEDHLWRSALRASDVFVTVQGIVLICSITLAALLHSTLNLALALCQLAVALILLLATTRTLHKSRPIAHDRFYADKELPTVTVAIPARNETNDLEECLRSVLASDYPKLEVIVLDDCSHDRTPEIIKGFAHDGVRFVKGAEPNDGWLAKNQAYDRLRQEATGEFIVFCGVDVRFGTHAIRSLVTTVLNRDKRMISILPRRLTAEPAGGLIQPMRYWWELALPRRYFDRPPVLSTCWIIDRKTLDKLGGFASVKRAIIPEAIFARELVRQDGYGFVRAHDDLDIQTRKSWDGQRQTAIRVRYPQVHRRPEVAFMIATAEFLFLLGPFIALVVNSIGQHWGIVAIDVLAIVLLMTTHLSITMASNPPNMPVALFNFPVAVLTEIFLGLESMIRYEFSNVTWKERNITFPVMHVISSLPRLEDTDRRQHPS